jgi:UDP-N-acetylglucosamine--dolichyl-phosphate N-acetylglucosaminephosphotransferase
MESILFICFAISFFATLLLTPYWIKVAKRANLAVRDMNKFKKPIISTAGGIAVMAGFLFGLLFYIALKTFIFKNLTNTVEILAVLCVVLIIGLIGFLDDVLGRLSLRRWQRPLLCLIAAIPLIVINSGRSIMFVPFVGPVNFGVLYPLLLIPIAISGAANGFNMLGGYNGLQAGLGAIILTALGIITWMHGNTWVSVICFCMVFALLAFLIFNKFPAKVFDGNTLSYIIGSTVACIAIIGNIERAALILFIPFFIELVLKWRGKMRKESFAIANKDGTITEPYLKIYGLEHIAIKLIRKIKKYKKVYEPEVVFSLWIFEIILAIIVILAI